jgi:hypothetical protein
VGNGAGQTIALVVIGADYSLISDLQYFDRQLFGSGPNGAQLLDTFASYNGPQDRVFPWFDVETDPNFPFGNYTPAQISKHDVETDIDVEWAHAIAPFANIVVVQSGSIQSGTLYASQLRTLKPQLGISIIASSSYHFPTFHPQDYADPSVTYVGITGDTGTSINSQQLGFSADNYPASSADIIAVGGTTLTLNPDGSYGSETGWGFAGPNIFRQSTDATYFTPTRASPWVSTPGGFGGVYYTVSTLLATANYTATWTTTVTSSFTLGRNDDGLEISATWPAAPANTNDAQFLIYDNGNLVQTVHVNEQVAPTGNASTLGANPATFQELCTLTGVHVGDTISVVLTGAGTLVADAVGFGPDDAGGGGLSNEPQPSYQNGLVIRNGNTIISANGTRANPDVAFDGDYINSPVEFYDQGSVIEGQSTTPIRFGAGTSLGAPAWAGLIAIIDQGLALVGHAPITTAGVLAGLYNLPSHDFHDETTGYNGYSAGPGYDLVTGLGSPIANLLVQDLVNRVAPIPSFIASLYVNDLGRSPSAAEINPWESLFLSQGKAAVVQGIGRSREAYTHLVDTLYMRYLGRPADALGVTNFVNYLQGGGTEERVLSAILGSTEYLIRVTAGASNPIPTYVQALYRDLLNRMPSAVEVNAWANAVGSLGMTTVAAGFVGSFEYRSDVIAGYYVNLLHRTTAPPEATAWANLSVDLYGLELIFETTPEYFQNN